MIKYANVIEWNGKMSASVLNVLSWDGNETWENLESFEQSYNNFRGDPATRYNEQWISRKKEQNIYIY